MEPISLIFATIAIFASGVSLFFKRLKKCKFSKCCEVEMNRTRNSEMENSDDNTEPKIEDLIESIKSTEV